MLSNAPFNTSIKGGASDKINKYMEHLDLTHNFLTNYQTAVFKYFESDLFRNKRLLLLWLSVGRGKTLLSISCGIAGLENGEFKRIVIMSPKSVQNEFEKNLNFYCYLAFGEEGKLEAYNRYSKQIQMIAYNSYKSYEEFVTNKTIGDHTNYENTLFIIDEAHLFFKSVIKVNLLPDDVNDEEKRFIGNANKIYTEIMSIEKFKVLALTGTPSAKTPYETIPMFNMAYEKLLFTENYEEFNEKYINDITNKIKHFKTLREKLDGLVAYVPPVTGVNASPLNIVSVEMSVNQYKQYLIDYEKELSENSFANKRNIYGLLFGSVSSFHTKTFQDCVYWNDDPNEITIDNEHCPKLIRMFNDSQKINGLCVFYFRFTNMFGIESMSVLLETQGYRRAGTRPEDVEYKSKRYIIFSGQHDHKLLSFWKNEYNKSRNKYGDYIKYILVSPAGQVGITLKNVRYLGIGSVDFNYSAIRQIMGRVNRLNSHNALPVEDRTLSNNIYIMTKNKKHYGSNKTDINELCSRTSEGIKEKCPTIENIIFHDSITDDKINEDYRFNVLLQSSITETIYKKF